jgi:hypothetical protein
MTNLEHAKISLVDSLRQYVLTPLVDAQSLVRKEYKEVDAERQAFQNLNERIAAINTVSSRPSAPKRQTTARHSNPKQVERLRSAYRETVMDVSHYEDTYGESLETHVAAEFSAGVATGFQPEGPLFTDVYKTHLTGAISQAIAQRKAFCERIETEQDSLVSSKDDLTDLLNSLDGIHIPAWYTTEFENVLSELAETRQETVQVPNQYRQVDNHDLYDYLYDDPEWTYPVLTAIERLHRSIEYSGEYDHSAIPVKD